MSNFHVVELFHVRFAFTSEGRNEVENGPGDDNAVVDIQVEDDEHGSDTDTYRQKLSRDQGKSHVV